MIKGEKSISNGNSALICAERLGNSLHQAWQARRYQPGDDQQIDALLKACLPAYQGPEKWEWIHRNNPLGFHGPDGDIWVAEDQEGTLVGYYSRIRYAMHCFGKIVLASQALNMTTHPHFRRQGIAAALMEASIRDARSNGIKITFGFPNKLSYPLAIKEGAIDSGSAGYMKLVLDPVGYSQSLQSGPVWKLLRRTQLTALGALRHKPGPVPTKFEVVRGFSDDAGSVEETVLRGFDLGLARTEQYLSWRYDSRWGPYESYSLVHDGSCSGYVVTWNGKRGDIGVSRILELMARDDDIETYEALLSVALQRAKERNSTYVAVASTGSESELRYLRRSGFGIVKLSGRYVFVPYDSDIGAKLVGARAYLSLGDRDYL